MSTASPEKRQIWLKRIEQQQVSEQSIERWCREQKIPAHQFHYWKNKLLPKSIRRTSFTELTDATEGLTIECGRFRIRIEKQCNFIMLKQCLEVLAQC